MGILRDVIGGAIGSATGANNVNNGFNGPRMPFRSDRNAYSSPGRVADSSDNLPPPYAADHQYDSSGSFEHRRSRSNEKHYYESNGKQRDFSTNSWDPSSSSRAYGQPSPRQPSPRQPSPDQSFWPTRSFRPLALPQTDYGDASPFLRAYSNELDQFGITEDAFIRIIDEINVAIIPSPEAQIFQTGANIAGWFLPGAAGIGLMAGQVGVGIGTAYGHASAIAKVLAKANLEVFVPRGLEICIGHGQDVDTEVIFSSSAAYQQYLNPNQMVSLPQQRLAQYGDALAPLSQIYPPVMNAGRNDPLASIGRSLGNRQNQKKLDKAREDTTRKGKTSKMDKLEGGLKWVMVRKASPDAVAHWQQVSAQNQQQETTSYDAGARY